MPIVLLSMSTELKSILSIDVPLIVQIAARKMTVGEVMNLAPGTIVELPKIADEELDLLVANKQIGSGRAVKVGENFGLRVTWLGDVRERIEAMAPTPTPAPGSGEAVDVDPDAPSADGG